MPLVGLFLLFGSVMILNAVNPATTVPARLRIYGSIGCNSHPAIEYQGFQRARMGQPSSMRIPANRPEASSSRRRTIPSSSTRPLRENIMPNSSGPDAHRADLRPEGARPAWPAGQLRRMPGNQAGYACVSAALAGTFTWSGHHYPRKIQILAVLRWSVAPSIDGIDKAVFGPEANLSVPRAEESGAGGFVIPAEIAALEQAGAKCGRQFPRFCPRRGV